MDEEKSEFGFIDWIRRQRKEKCRDVITDVGDDMAVLRLGGEKLLITTDALLEGVHFELANSEKNNKSVSATLEQVGYKAMACSLSDCAAMAAVPFVAVAAVALPRSMSMDKARRLYRGMQQAAEKYNCPIVGGDVTSWDKPLAVDVTMLGRVGDVEPILRSGAQVGDAIMVTGELGGSRLGRHFEFVPRVAEAQMLGQMAELHAMIDISDGLSGDLGHICRESKVSAEIDSKTVPISRAARSSAAPLAAALNDGEDFELLFCVSPNDAEKLLADWPSRSNLSLSRIGRIIEPEGEERVFIRQANGKVEPLEVRGWQHFSD